MKLIIIASSTYISKFEVLILNSNYEDKKGIGASKDIRTKVSRPY